METRDIIEYIDSWLADSPYLLDNRTTDFALDVRSMVETLAEELDAAPTLVSVA